MKRIIINNEQLQKRIAVTEDGKIQEYYIETGNAERIVGSIYKGKITNLEPSLQAAFVDIGLEKNAFLHYWDMIPATKDDLENNDSGQPETVSDFIDIDEIDDKPAPKETNNKPPTIGNKIMNFLLPPKKKPPMKSRITTSSRPRKPIKKLNSPIKPFDIKEIPKKFSVNTEVIVQVTKGPIGTKGPRVTTNLSMPGRYVVLLPNSDHIGISRRIADREERRRLRDIFRRVNLPKGMGLICRTASTGLSESALLFDIEILLDKWNRSRELIRKKKAPLCLYLEPGILETTIRDSLSDDVGEIIADGKPAYDLTLSYLKNLDEKDQTKVKLYDNPIPIFDNYKVTDQIGQIYQRAVTLPSGAELCVDETEALIAIDVNSKKSRKGKDHPETILNTNLEAAVEVGRQLRLRNIGGLVIVDFIDMRSRKDRQLVYRRMKEVVEKDRARTKILPISRLGLLEMTRQREYESLRDSTYQTCSYCEGKGLIKSSIMISVEIQRRLQEMLRRDKGITKIKITVHPVVLSRLKHEDADILESMEKEFGGELSFRADPSIHREDFKILDVGKKGRK